MDNARARALLGGLDLDDRFQQGRVGGGGQGRAEGHGFAHRWCALQSKFQAVQHRSAESMHTVGVQRKHNSHKTQNPIVFGVKTAFSDLLQSLIAPRFTSQREFARALGPPSKEHANASYISQVLADKKPPPLERLDTWADALELYGDERQRFMDLAAIAHLPVEVQPRFLVLLRQLKSQQATIEVQKVTLESQQVVLENYQIRLAAAERDSD